MDLNNNVWIKKIPISEKVYKHKKIVELYKSHLKIIVEKEQLFDRIDENG